MGVSYFKKKLKGHTYYERYGHLVGFKSLESQHFWGGHSLRVLKTLHYLNTEKYISGS